MPKPELRIAVLTLSPGDEAQLIAGTLGTALTNMVNQGAIKYSAAPDNWIPFDDGTTILRHLEQGLATFQVYSDSTTLASFKIRRGIKLFVIDPAVLLHPAKARLATLIQEHVCSRDDKASCIIIGGPLPPDFVKDLRQHYMTELKDLVDEADVSLVDYRVDDGDRLRQFLRRVTPLLGDVPVSPRIAEAIRTLTAVNRGLAPAIGTPMIGGGA